MGKNRIRDSLIRGIANVVVHEIVARHTNRPESAHFLRSEVIEYKNQAGDISGSYNWNNEDKKIISDKALERIKDILSDKYQDVNYSEKEIINKLEEVIGELINSP